MRVKLTLEYDGTNYCGWQRQPNGMTIQEKIEECYFAALGEKVTITASGRTDSGVHARCQVAHFDTQKGIPAEKFCSILNVVLPEDIRVLSSTEVDESFHARYGVKKKTYTYRFYCSQFIRPLYNRYATRINEGVDVEKMQSACKLLIGKHDFKAFSSSGSSIKGTERELYFAQVEKEREIIAITVTGSGFLYNMVRIIAGTLLEIGFGKLDEGNITKAFETLDRSLLGKTVAPNGLTMEKVEY